MWCLLVAYFLLVKRVFLQSFFSLFPSPPPLLLLPPLSLSLSFSLSLFFLSNKNAGNK